MWRRSSPGHQAKGVTETQWTSSSKIILAKQQPYLADQFRNARFSGISKASQVKYAKKGWNGIHHARLFSLRRGKEQFYVASFDQIPGFVIYLFHLRELSNFQMIEWFNSKWFNSHSGRRSFMTSFSCLTSNLPPHFHCISKAPRNRNPVISWSTLSSVNRGAHCSHLLQLPRNFQAVLFQLPLFWILSIFLVWYVGKILFLATSFSGPF